ncbi:hypothetical protein AB7M70_011851 [Bradyrhizobium japonicum]
MKNVKAIVLANTANLTVENFYDSQDVLHNPMVLFMEEGTNNVIKFFRVAAKSMESFKEMVEHRYFDTPDLPDERYVVVAGAYFVGCGPDEDIIKEHTAATVCSA